MRRLLKTDAWFQEMLEGITSTDAHKALRGLYEGTIKTSFQRPRSRFIEMGVEGDEKYLALREVISIAASRQLGGKRLTSEHFNPQRDVWCINRLKDFQIIVFTNIPVGKHPLLTNTEEDAEEQYEADDLMRTAKIRQKQSKFSRLVRENFEDRCCLSGIAERDLLVASHIVPWQKNKTIRLDPRNGFLFDAIHDRLFEEGYISFEDDLTVLVTNNLNSLSDPLKLLLKGLKGQITRQPVKWKIRPAYLWEHRTKVFRG